MFGISVTKFARDRKGNVAIIFALSLVPCIFLAGMALDFTVATQRRVVLNSAADAGALAAVTPAMMQQSSTNAQTAATNAFNAVASTVTGTTSITPTITVADSEDLIRTATVAYTANSTNNFSERPETADRSNSGQLADFGNSVVDGIDGPQHRFLSAAGQFAVDEYRSDHIRHQHHGLPYVIAGRVCIRLS